MLSLPELAETSLNGLVYRIDPDPGILLHVPVRQARDQFVILLRGGHYSARLEINDDGFCALSTAIDADVEHTN